MTDYASDILIPASPNGIIVTMQYDENSSSSNRSGIIGIIADDAIYKPGASVIQKPKTVSVTISGSVQDQFNYPLIGVTVQLKENPGIYTMTDDTGAYFLGPNQELYIVYAYGNGEFTSKMDIVLFE